MTVLLQTATQWVVQGLLAKLQSRGYREITESHLNLFGNLDCGATYASAVAQRIGVSRQAVYRTVRELQDLGFLRLEQDQSRGNQKLVIMTDKGIQLANDGRQALGEIEEELAKRVGNKAVNALRATLESEWGQTLD